MNGKASRNFRRFSPHLLNPPRRLAYGVKCFFLGGGVLDRLCRQVQSPLRLLDFRKFLQIRQIEFEIKATGILSVHLGPR